MLRNYLKNLFRNLRKHPATTGIHLLGLTLGLTACLLILLFVHYEWGFDRYHQLGDRIYRVNMIEYNGTETEYSSITPSARFRFTH